MQQLTEAKFPRTGKEYKLEKTETGFNFKLIDLDDELKPIFKTFQQLLEMSQAEPAQIVFKGFEEKRNEGELILINHIHQTEITSLQTQLQNSETEKNEQILKLETEITLLKSEIDELKAEIENQKSIIVDLEEAKKLIPAESEPQSNL